VTNLIDKPQTKEGNMSKIGFGLDANEPFPGLKIQLLSAETIELPEYTGDGYGVFLVYRGYW
jgi:hypothetical protein